MSFCHKLMMQNEELLYFPSQLSRAGGIYVATRKFLYNFIVMACC